MNISTLNIIIAREYLNKVRKKSFLIITFLTPILFAAICILPSVIMMATREEAKKVAVVDRSGLVLPALENTEVIEYMDFSTADPDSLKGHLKEFGVDVLLTISELDPQTKSLSAETFSEKPLGMETSEIIEKRINDAVEAYRIESYNIEGLRQILSDVKPNDVVRIHSSADTEPIPYENQAGIRDTALEVRRARSDGIAVVCIFTGDDEDIPSAKLVYGKDFVRIQSFDRLADAVGRLIQNQIKNI